MRKAIVVAAGLLPALAVSGTAKTILYHVSSKQLDISVTETVRNNRTSILRIPGYNDRSASASRWLMCAYTDLAKKRGFKFWAVVSPVPPSDDVLIGFPMSEQEDTTKTLGPQFTDGNMLAASTEDMAAFCGM